MTRFLIIFIILLSPCITMAQSVIPPHNDEYSAYVKKLEAGDTTVNYTDFRNSFRTSKQFKIKESIKPQYDSLQRNVGKFIQKEDYDNIIKTMRAMLAIDYTSLFAHKYISQAYTMKNDKKNAEKHLKIEEGLLQSIIKSGDGTGCNSGWKVIQKEEQYFVVYMLGSTYKSEEMFESGNRRCNAISVTEKPGNSAIYYFDVSEVIGVK